MATMQSSVQSLAPSLAAYGGEGEKRPRAEPLKKPAERKPKPQPREGEPQERPGPVHRPKP
jgi:hypothetical protein